MAKQPYNPSDPFRFQETLGKFGKYFTPQGTKPRVAPQGPTGGRRFYQGPADVSRTTPTTPIDYTQIPRTSGGRPATGVDRRVEENRAAATAVGTGGAGGAANPINALFAPLFQNLRQQRQMANKRYEANRNQVTNIYGQITSARETDIPALETAFKRLVDAASTRSTAVNTQIDTAEAARLAGNQAALQSMGLEGLSTSQGDVASQGAALAQQTNTLNAENWQNLLRASGVNAQEIARADVTGYNYAMLEDLGQLRGAREEFAQDLGQQRFELKSKKAQATFEYQQAQQRAAAAAKAAQQRQMAEMTSEAQKQMAESLKASGPVISTVSQLVGNGSLPDTASGAKVIDVITEWYQNVPPPPTGKWNAASATNSILSLAGASLTPAERTAIQAVFSNSKW
jgi:hypothetical protein